MGATISSQVARVVTKVEGDLRSTDRAHSQDALPASDLLLHSLRADTEEAGFNTRALIHWVQRGAAAAFPDDEDGVDAHLVGMD